jgi:hypothetical protein
MKEYYRWSMMNFVTVKIAGGVEIVNRFVNAVDLYYPTVLIIMMNKYDYN